MSAIKPPCSARFFLHVAFPIGEDHVEWGVLDLGRSRPSPFSSLPLDFSSSDLVLSQCVKMICIWGVLDLGCALNPFVIEIRNVPGLFSLAILQSKSMTMAQNGIGREAPLQIPAKKSIG